MPSEFEEGRIVFRPGMGVVTYPVRWIKKRSVEPPAYKRIKERGEGITLRYSVQPLWGGKTQVTLSHFVVPARMQPSALKAFGEVVRHFDGKFGISRGQADLLFHDTWLLTAPRARRRIEGVLGRMGLRRENVVMPGIGSRAKPLVLAPPRNDAEFLGLVRRAHSELRAQLDAALSGKGKPNFLQFAEKHLGENAFRKIAKLHQAMSSALKAPEGTRQIAVSRAVSNIVNQHGVDPLYVAYNGLFIPHKIVKK